MMAGHRIALTRRMRYKTGRFFPRPRVEGLAAEPGFTARATNHDEENKSAGGNAMQAAIASTRPATASTHPLSWVPTGYVTMALTYNMLTAAAVVMFSNLGMDNARAAEYASALGIAYTIKPLFAAFLEMYKSK